ncbi:BTB/POZ domain-containing protein 1 [Aphelenchoides avenae]|nr:BTB/POZ domain-containing protein 1 [Aphelenchus avenae]
MAKTRDKSPTFYQFSFWSRVEEYARPLVESEEFLLLKKATVVDLLQRNLEVAETTIFKRVVAWGEAECESIPLMSSLEFALDPYKSGLLTQEEQMDMIHWFKDALTPTLFPTAERCRRCVCNRFTAMSGKWHQERSTDAFVFEVDRCITIVGVGLCGVWADGPAEYQVSVELHVNGSVQRKEAATMTSQTSEAVMIVTFEKPFVLTANIVCTVAATIKGPPTRRGIGEWVARQIVQTAAGAVTFSSSKSTLSSNGTSVESGQLPQIIFKVD